MSSRHIRGPLVFNTYTEKTSSGNVTVGNESVVLVNKTSGAATGVTLPAASSTDGRRAILVVDSKGDAATNNITVSVASSGTINGSSTHVISENYGKMLFVDVGDEWQTALPSEVSAAEIAFLNGVTAGTATASKALVLDSSKGIATITSLTSTTVVTTNINGAGSTVAVADRMTTTDGVTSGTARVIGGRAYTNTAASTAVTAVTAETAFDTNYSIPANTLKAGTLVKIRYQGIATATNSTDTLAIKLYLATDTTAGAIVGTTLISHAATDVANNDVFQGEYQLLIRTVGSSGTMVGCGTYKSVPAAEGTATYKDDILASTTVNTTVAQIVAVTATWSTNNAGNSCRLDVLSVEIA